ncbi:MAG TPA: hypothetical protein VGC79_20115 [Polyangiaceae bacterium]
MTELENDRIEKKIQLSAEAFRANDGGWSEQLKNIERHVAH